MPQSIPLRPWSLNGYNAMVVARVQLPFQTDMPYKTKLVILKILPLCYWHECLDNFFLFKCTHGLISTNLLPEVDTLSSNLNVRSSDDSLTKYNIPKVRALSDQNSYLIRVSRAWNCLPNELHKHGVSFRSFKCSLLKYYHSVTQTVFDQDNPRA